MKRASILGATRHVCVAAPAIAHHSFAAEFDETKTVKLTGKVVECGGPTRMPGSTWTSATDGKIVTGRSRPARRTAVPPRLAEGGPAPAPS